MSLLRQGDWQATGHFLSRAIQVNPALSDDLGLFYDIALGTQPLGYRDTSLHLDLAKSAADLRSMLDTVFSHDCPPGVFKLRHAVYCTAYRALGLVAYNTGRFDLGWRFLFLSVRYRPRLVANRQIVGTILKALLKRFRVIGSPRRSEQTPLTQRHG